MKNVNRIINESGLSKVSVAKYLGVSRQMLYNYLAFDNFKDLPKDKQNKLFNLFGIKKESELKSITVDEDFIKNIEIKVHDGIIETNNKESIANFDGLDREQQETFTDVITLLKERILSCGDKKEKDALLKYFLYFIQSLEQVEENKYILGYVAKNNGFVNPNEFVFKDEDKQYTFEGILFSAMNLYNNGSASKNKVVESHKKFEMEIEAKKEEKLGRTQELNTFRDTALSELGYTSVTEENAKEVFEKIAEIMSRKF